MPKVSTYTRTRIELLHKQGLHPAGIFTSLKSEGLSVSFSSVTRIIKKLRFTGSVKNLPRSGRPQKLSTEAKAFIDQQMRNNDEMTSAQIMEWLLVRQLCEDHASSKAGLYSGLGTASLYEMPTKSSGWSTHNESWRVATLSTT